MSIDPRGTDVLILLPELDSGGVARVACILASGFAREGLSTSIASIGDGQGPARALLDPQVSVDALPLVGGRPRSLLARLCAAPTLIDRLRRRPPAVLLSPGNHVHLFAALIHFASGGASQLVLKLTNPIVKSHHGPVRQWIRRLVFRWMFGRAASILALTPEAAAEAAAVAPAAAEKVRVATNPYLADNLHGDGAALTPVDSQTPLVLAVGRLTGQKNFELLLESMAALPPRPWRLAILGSGKSRARLERLAERLGIADRVAFVGYAPDPGAYYRHAALLVVTSRWEGLPGAVVEALAAGCPVVTTDCSPALSRIVRGSGKGAVTAATPEALAASISKVLDTTPDRTPASQALGFTVSAGIHAHLMALRGLGGGMAGEPAAEVAAAAVSAS